VGYKVIAVTAGYDSVVGDLTPTDDPSLRPKIVALYYIAGDVAYLENERDALKLAYTGPSTPTTPSTGTPDLFAITDGGGNKIGTLSNAPVEILGYSLRVGMSASDFNGFTTSNIYTDGPSKVGFVPLAKRIGTAGYGNEVVYDGGGDLWDADGGQIYIAYRNGSNVDFQLVTDESTALGAEDASLPAGPLTFSAPITTFDTVNGKTITLPAVTGVTRTIVYTGDIKESMLSGNVITLVGTGKTFDGKIDVTYTTASGLTETLSLPVDTEAADKAVAEGYANTEAVKNATTVTLSNSSTPSLGAGTTLTATLNTSKVLLSGATIEFTYDDTNAELISVSVNDMPAVTVTPGGVAGARTATIKFANGLPTITAGKLNLTFGAAYGGTEGTKTKVITVDTVTADTLAADGLVTAAISALENGTYAGLAASSGTWTHATDANTAKLDGKILTFTDAAFANMSAAVYRNGTAAPLKLAEASISGTTLTIEMPILSASLNGAALVIDLTDTSTGASNSATLTFTTTTSDAALALAARNTAALSGTVGTTGTPGVYTPGTAGNTVTAGYTVSGGETATTITYTLGSDSATKTVVTASFTDDDSDITEDSSSVPGGKLVLAVPAYGDLTNATTAEVEITATVYGTAATGGAATITITVGKS
jgi:hypothetical protein